MAQAKKKPVPETLPFDFTSRVFVESDSGCKIFNEDDFDVFAIETIRSATSTCFEDLKFYMEELTELRVELVRLGIITK